MFVILATLTSIVWLGVVFSGAHVSHCGKYLIITPIKGCRSNLLYFAKLEYMEYMKLLPLEAVVTKFESDYEVSGL